MIRSRSKEPPNDKLAPTPLSELNRLAKRQRKYHPARPYRWWEYKPMQAEPSEVHYPQREPGPGEYHPLFENEAYARARLSEIENRNGFWQTLATGVVLFLFFGGTGLLVFGILKLLFGGL